MVHIFQPSLIKSNLDSTFGIVTRLHAGKQNSHGLIPGRDKKYNIYLLQSIQIRSQDHPVSYLIATGDTFLRRNLAELR